MHANLVWLLQEHVFKLCQKWSTILLLRNKNGKEKEWLWENWGGDNLEDTTYFSVLLGAEGLFLHILPEMFSIGIQQLNFISFVFWYILRKAFGNEAIFKQLKHTTEAEIK